VATESLGELIKRLRERSGLSQPKLASLSGLDRSHISLLERGKRGNITQRTAEKLALALEVSPKIFFTGREVQEDNLLSPPKDIVAMLRDLESALQGQVLAKIPLLGIVPGGEPLTPLDSPLEYVLVPQNLTKGARRPFAVKLSGESLEGYGLHNGDTLVIDPDAEVIDGKIYIVLIGAETTAKKLYRDNDRLRLEGSNGSTEIMSPHRVENLGKVIGHGHWTED
jgi:repressor LexA